MQYTCTNNIKFIAKMQRQLLTFTCYYAKYITPKLLRQIYNDEKAENTLGKIAFVLLVL